MKKKKKARDFYDAFIGRTWNYPTDIRMSIASSAQEEWSYACENADPSQIKKRFMSGIKEGADFLEKEGGYQGKKTAEAIREILDELIPLYTEEDESLSKNDEASEDEFSFDIDSIREVAKELDIELAGQFIVESMTSGIDYKPITSFSNTEIERSLQQQYNRYCLMAKSNIVIDSINPQHDKPTFLTMFKDYLLNYISDPKNKEHAGMKHFYHLTEDDLIIHQISMFSYMANMKNVVDIHQVTNEELHNAFNPESASLAIGLYTYFTIIVNRKYSKEDFNKLFVESWIDYYNNFKARYLMLKMNGNNWKKQFKGALLSD